MDSSDRWSRIQSVLEVYFEAIEHGRKPELESLCGGDLKLFEEVKAIVASDSGAVGILAEFEKRRADDDAPMPAKIGPFQTIAPIGRGGMGRVYLAQESRTERFVAVKVLPQNAGPTDRARFLREGRTIAMIEHKNIVPIYSVGDEGDQPYIAMKWLSGPGLDAIPEPMDPRQAAVVGAAVARALDFAHRNGVIHRDVKPANIILDLDIPYVVDFGLARCETDVTLTRQNAVPGTLLYMAPENLRGNRPSFDPRIDVYGLGAVLYEIIAGRPIFELAEIEPLMQTIVAKEPEPLGLRGAARDLETIIFRALDKDPARRFQTGEAMAEDLERWLDGRPIVSRRIGLFGRLARHARRRPRLAAAGVVLSLAIGAVTAAWIEDAREKRRVFLQDVKAVERLIDEGRTKTARVAIDSLKRSDPNDPEPFRLESVADAVDRLEDLADLLYSRRESEDREIVRSAIRAIDRSFLPPSCSIDASYTLAIAHYIIGDDKAAADNLKSIPLRPDGQPRRGVSAMTALMNGKMHDWRPEAGGDGSADHFFAALSLFHGSRPIADVRSELELAREASSDDLRIEMLATFLLADVGESERALGRFEAIDLGERKSPVVARRLAILVMQMGDDAAAERRLQEIPLSAQTAFDLHCRVQLAWRAGRRDEVRRLLSKDSEWVRFADHPEILLDRSALAEFDGLWPEMKRHAQRCAEIARYPDFREQAESRVFAATVLEVVAQPATSNEKSDGEKILNEGRALAARLRAPDARSRVMTSLGRLEERNGNISSAFDWYDSAMSLSDEDAPSRILLGMATYKLMVREPGSMSLSRILAAQSALWRVVEIFDRGRMGVGRETVVAALKAHAAISAAIKDSRGALRSLQKLWPLVDSSNLLTSVERASLEDIEDWARGAGGK